jgi:AmmeMemoRadiSam system protein A
MDSRRITHFEPLDRSEQETLLALAREAIEKYAASRRMPEKIDISEDSRVTEKLRERRGVFVTLYRLNALRGCIGNHSTEDCLVHSVPRMAVASGFDDPRFPPLSREELSDLLIELSVYLTPVFPVDDPEEIELGKHGIIIVKGGRRATFLPKVAPEQGWDKATTLAMLCRKAGLPPDAWKDSDARFSVYQVQDFDEAP